MLKTVALASICIFGTPTLAFWPFTSSTEKHDPDQETQDLQIALQFLKKSQPEKAIAIIKNYSDEINDKTENGKQWLDLLIQASVETRNTPQLIILYEKFPKAFENAEEASLLVANGLLLARQGNAYQTLRDAWKGKETKRDAWWLLDADKLLVEEKTNDAYELLRSKTLEGKAESNRLIRLALLSISNDPRQAWDYLTEALSKDPKNPDIYTYRARILESIGKDQLAQIEYIGAAQADPSDYHLQDQLAEFYLRTRQYPQALDTWAKTLKSDSLDFLWVKTFFWNKVLKPLSINWREIPLPDTKLEPYIEYLIDLPGDVFWDEAKFDQLEDTSKILQSQQSAYWLRLLDVLKHHKEKEAWDMLQYNSFQGISWNPELEQALKKILIFRKSKKFSINSFAQPNQAHPHGLPAFFEQLETLAQQEEQKIPEDVQALLESDQAFMAATLAAGWNEAALILHEGRGPFPENFPDWVSYDFTQALRQNVGPVQALNFALQQRQTSALSLLIGELYVALQKPDEALNQLQKLADEPSDIGYRAAWLTSLIYLDQKKLEEARNAVNAQPKLKQSVLGKEVLARIALLEGNANEAGAIYTEIEADSPEAKSYLARKAYTEGNWQKAKQLTEELLKANPLNPILKENLKKIQEEEKNAPIRQ